VIAPGWVVREAMRGAARAGAPVHVGDPLLSWLYQPAVRVFRVGFYGDDRAFIQARLPAVFVSDSSFSSFYPWYHQASDTKEKLDALALGRIGGAVAGMVQALQSARRGADVEPSWFFVLGQQLRGPVVVSVVALSLLPGLLLGLSRGGLLLAARALSAALVAVLLWRQPVATLWVYPLPALLALGGWRLWRFLLSLTPLASLLALGAAAWSRGLVHGIWLSPWELVVAALALVLLWLSPPARRAPRSRRKRS
jgi:hypothetical protein